MTQDDVLNICAALPGTPGDHDPYRLVDRIDPGHLDAAAAVLRPHAEGHQPPIPASLGMGHSGHGDLTDRAGELLAEDGFGEWPSSTLAR